MISRDCPKNTNCYHCDACNEIQGVGGAGGYSDGKLCNEPVSISEEMKTDAYTSEVYYVNKVFSEILGEQYRPSKDTPLFKSTPNSSEEITEVVFLGTFIVRDAFQSLYEGLTISKLLGDRVINVDFVNNRFVVETYQGQKFSARYLIVATGKYGFHGHYRGN